MLTFHQHRLYASCATNRFFQVFGNIHDIQDHLGSYRHLASLNDIFISHWAHLGLIIAWLTASFFHLGFQGNYEIWSHNPIKVSQIAHSIFDPHLSTSEPEVNIAYSGLYNLLFTIGFSNTSEIFRATISLECACLASGILSIFHSSYMDSLLYFSSASQAKLSLHSSLNTLLSLNTNKLATSLPVKLFNSIYDASQLRLNYHTAFLIGVS